MVERRVLCYNPDMFGLTKPKLPITPEQQRWVDNSFLRLEAILGSDRLLQATVVLPTPDHFPDPYATSFFSVLDSSRATSRTWSR